MLWAIGEIEKQEKKRREAAEFIHHAIYIEEGI